MTPEKFILLFNLRITTTVVEKYPWEARTTEAILNERAALTNKILAALCEKSFSEEEIKKLLS